MTLPIAVGAQDAERGTTLITSVKSHNVLIVGVNYAPEPFGIAPYTTQIAEAFAETAASVTVLCGPPSYPHWRVQAGYRSWRRNERLGQVDVSRLWHYVPRRQTALKRTSYELSFGLRVATAKRTTEPDLVYAVTPSLAGAYAGARIARRCGAPLIVHVQDLVGSAAAQSGIAGGASVARYAAALEQRTLRSASRVLLASRAFEPVLAEYGVAPQLTTLLPNWTRVEQSLRDRRDVRRELGWPQDVIVALHSGSMGSKQNLENVVQAARASVGRPILWVLMGDGSQRQALEREAEGLRNLVIRDPCSESEYPDLLDAADVLLVNERPSVSDMSLPSKLTSYRASGRPIVAAVPDGGATACEVAGVATVVQPGRARELAHAVERAGKASPQQARARVGQAWRAVLAEAVEKAVSA